MWKKININIQNIKGESDNSFLIAMPHNSDYDGFCFWHPKILVREGLNSYALTLSYTEEFSFRLVKYGKGKSNRRDIISEKKIDAEDFEEAFGVMSDNIKEPIIKDEYETHIPDEIEAKETKVLDELKDNE